MAIFTQMMILITVIVFSVMMFGAYLPADVATQLQGQKNNTETSINNLQARAESFNSGDISNAIFTVVLVPIGIFVLLVEMMIKTPASVVTLLSASLGFGDIGAIIYVLMILVLSITLLSWLFGRQTP